jgi:hypothetical protein
MEMERPTKMQKVESAMDSKTARSILEKNKACLDDLPVYLDGVIWAHIRNMFGLSVEEAAALHGWAQNERRKTSVQGGNFPYGFAELSEQAYF